ncbi:MAG: sulfite oxidase [Gemmatimonadota bacterium]
MNDLRVDELNCETPLSAAAESVTPPGSFFVRNHFPVPPLRAEDHVLEIGGDVRAPLRLTLDDLQARSPAGAVVTLECAGNGRASMDPRAPGTQWRLGAFGTARFSGTALAPLLRSAEPLPGAEVVVFTGADRGEVEPDRTEAFARSLPLADALSPAALLAWEMNGEPLPADHGFPLRSVMPDRYGVDSVKWLVRIEVRAEPFRGFYQAERYRYLGEAGVADGTTVALMRPRSLIGYPTAGETLGEGERITIRGSAWSGYGAIASVEVSTDGGASWRQAGLVEDAPDHGPTLWESDWVVERGAHQVVARATDEEGNTQPLTGVWNAHGYGNNEVHRVDLEVS